MGLRVFFKAAYVNTGYTLGGGRHGVTHVHKSFIFKYEGPKKATET